jgi:hypothetical protein
MAIAYFSSSPANAGFIDFTMIPNGEGLLSYSGKDGTFVGREIPVQIITGIGTPKNSGIENSLSIKAEFDFQTGKYLSCDSTSWTFDKGGTFSIRSIDTSGKDEVDYYKGTFSNPIQVSDLGNGLYKVFGASTQGFLDKSITNYYGLPTIDVYEGGLAILFSSKSKPGEKIEDGRFTSGDCAVNVVPEPSSWAILTVLVLSGGLLFRQNLLKS